MTAWSTVRLGELADFRNGLNFSASDRGPGVAVVGIPDFQGRLFVEYSELDEVTQTVVKSDSDLIKAGDILFVRSNGNRELIGRSLLVREAPPKPTSHSGFTIRLRFKDVRADPRFFAYLVRSDSIRRRMSNQGGGTNINNLNQGILSNLEVPLPPLDTQRRIAAILGAYDDLIEVNRRRVAVLEEMARVLFEEWFVRFRFPGHENVPIVDTPDGPLPEGWEVGLFGNLFDHTIGGLWGEPEASPAKDQLVTVVRGTDFPRLLSGKFDSIPTRFVGEKELSKRKIVVGDIILEASGGSKDQPVGRTLFVAGGLFASLGPVMAPASFCRLLRAKPQAGVAEYCYGLLTAMYEDRRIEKFQKQSTGLRNLSMKQLEAELIMCPTAEPLESFCRTVRPMHDAMAVHRNEMDTLAASRDLLLPRLISGQLSVEAAERELELAA